MSLNETIAPEDISFIVPGKTTLGEIVERLGAPDEITAPDRGIAYTVFGRRLMLKARQVMMDSRHRAVARYRFVDLKRFRVNFTWAVQFILSAPGIPDDVVFQGVGIGTDEFLVVLDSNWVVQYHAFARHAEASQYRHWPFDLEPPDENQIVSF